MNRAERFYKTSKIKDNHGFDVVMQYKVDVGKVRAIGNNPAQTVSAFYAGFAVNRFDIKEIFEELKKCFYKAYDVWMQGECPKFTVLDVKNKLGTKDYNRAVKTFRDSSMRARLEKAGFNRVGFVTFINMLCYLIWKQSYQP